MAADKKPVRPDVKLPKPPRRSGELRDRLLFWIALIIAVVGLSYFYSLTPRERPLDCGNGGGGNLLQFGTCQER